MLGHPFLLARLSDRGFDRCNGLGGINLDRIVSLIIPSSSCWLRKIWGSSLKNILQRGFGCRWLVVLTVWLLLCGADLEVVMFAQTLVCALARFGVRVVLDFRLVVRATRCGSCGSVVLHTTPPGRYKCLTFTLLAVLDPV